MSDYRQEQDWLMRELEDSQHYLKRKETEDIITGIDRKMRSRIVKHMRVMYPKVFATVLAKDCFERWKAGYRLQKPAAVELLAFLKELDRPDFTDM
jgi:hypothetical protein